MNTHSEHIGELAAALAKAQAENGTVTKDSANPYFKSSYASLAAVWEATRPYLAKHGLSVVQMPSHDEKGCYVETMLLHSSGQWIKSKTYMRPAKDDPQGIGSAISYARRYALQAVTMVCPEDDDGEAAMGRPAPQKPVEAPKPVKKTEPKVEAPKAETKADPKKDDNKFKGPFHKQLFQDLAKAGYTPDEFLEAFKREGKIPAAATDFFLMKEETAQKYAEDIQGTLEVIREYKAFYQP